jgi:hypothetical protein
MLTFWLFILSGVVVLALTLAKRMGERKKLAAILLKVVATGDEQVRKIHHEALHFYSEGKDKYSFWLKKQLPLKLKSLSNRALSLIRERLQERFGDVRNSRLLKRSDGISEFFKNISEVEKGGGEINETLTDEIQNDFYITNAEKPVKVTETKIDTVITTTVEEEPVHVVAPIITTHRNPNRKAKAVKAVVSVPKKQHAPKKKRERIRVLEVQEIL